MKKKSNRILPAAFITLGLFLVTAAAAFLILKHPAAIDASALALSLLAGGVVAVLTIPVLLWLSLRKPSPGDYSGYALEELDLSEEDLEEAVANWVFAVHKKRTEEDLRFLEDEDGSVSCRVTVRKD